MSLSHASFKVLNYLRATPGVTQRDIASGTGLSLGSVNSALKLLTENGFIEDAAITDAGFEALHPYKVNNAIILAAGLSSRFAPISYEKPKGLLRVRGEVLIERQIEQLHEAGIQDITVVVGYKKAYFFYLESKYGISIVVNNEYASKNNHSSLYCVRNRLANTYICSSDDYFTENPFEPYVWHAYYAAQWSEGPTKEWCMSTGPHNRIVGVTVGGEQTWYMLGHVYFDSPFSSHMRALLEETYDLPETADKLWEDLFVEHIKEFDMVVRPYDDGVINEFDSLDELRSFDPAFIENVDSEIFDNIVSVLGCSKTEIHDVYPLKQGLTNLSCHFSTNDGEYVYRHPGVGTELLIDREGEVAAQQTARDLGIDGTFIFEDPKRGWKISHFIKDCKNLDTRDPVQVATAMRMGRELHESGVTVSRSFDFYQEAERYKSLILERGTLDIPDFAEMAGRFDKLESFVKKDEAPVCLCHNDFFMLNFLIDGEGKNYLIDWEYAGMSDYANDYGTFCVCCELDEDEAYRALVAYFDREPTAEELRHNYAHIALAGWCWYLWSLLKESEGDFVGDWLYIYYNYAVKYLNKALTLYEEE